VGGGRYRLHHPDGVFLMSFQFPNSPAINDSFTPVGGPTYTWDGTVWKMGVALGQTAQSSNRVVNGAMQHSQENGRNNLTASGGYCADQWAESHVSDGTLSGYASVANTYLGADAGPWCATCVIGTADAALAAGQYLQFFQYLEGNRVADFNWGTADARPIVLRFKATSSIAMTFAVAIRNGAGFNRSYVKNCTIAANTPTWFTLVIPGDTAGTWATDTQGGFSVTFCLGAGTTFQASADTWSAGNFFATTATTNMFATAGARFSFGAVGLYLDPNNTGVPPPWQTPDYASELAACQRYWQIGTIGMDGYNPVAASLGYGNWQRFGVSMRVTPAMTYVRQISTGTSASTAYDALQPYGFHALVASNAAAGGFAWWDIWTANARM
jgi:hypothetical protein